jgi:hypothetical protein
MDATPNSPIIAKENRRMPGCDLSLFIIEQPFAEQCRIM